MKSDILVGGSDEVDYQTAMIIGMPGQYNVQLSKYHRKVQRNRQISATKLEQMEE